MIRIKYIGRGMFEGAPSSTVGDCVFIYDSACQEYDWLVVYDEFPKEDVGSLVGQAEPLACPREHTILVTSEPPSIKIYPRCYTSQFGHVITTHLPKYLPHPHHHIGAGALMWMAGYPYGEVISEPDYEKTRQLSTVCSGKVQKHTMHYARFSLTKYLSEHLPELEWFGRGVRPLENKYDALNSYRYHIAVENHIEAYHWTDKISDPLLGLCLTFYAGDPKLSEVLPADCFIPIPVDDPPRALEIIRTAMANNEYEKRLPAIREARHLLATRYNFWQQVMQVVHENQDAPTAPVTKQQWLCGRHRLRRNPLNALGEFLQLCRFRFRRVLPF